jgi:hypothetical protein
MWKCGRVESLLDYVAPALALRRIGNALQHRFPGLAAGEVLVSEREREAQDRNAGVVHAFVELLGPQPHPGAAERIGGLERRIGEALIEIFIDDVGFRHDDIAVD